MSTDSPQQSSVEPKKQSYGSWIMWSLLLLIGLSPLPLSFLYATYSYGSPAVYTRVAWIPGYLSLGCLSFLFWLPILFLAIFVKPLERAALIACPVILLFIVTTIISLPLSASIHHREHNKAMHVIAKNGKPLVDAIEAYRLDHDGRVPVAFNDLVPTYLTAIPSTGFGCYPNFRLFHKEKIPHYYPQSDWIVDVRTPLGFLDWDTLYFLPAQNYEDTPMRESVTLIPMGDGRDWGYFNE